MKTIKELESEIKELRKELGADLVDDQIALYRLLELNTLKDVIKLIDERIKMLKEITESSRQVNKQKALMEIFKASIDELEKLKVKIKGNDVEVEESELR